MSNGRLGLRILLGCFEVPGYGGAATASYNLFRRMLGDGLNAQVVNFVPEKRVRSFRVLYGDAMGNPEELPGVTNWMVPDTWTKPDPALAAFVEETAPDIMLGIGYIAAHILGGGSSRRPLVFMTVGCQQSQAYLERGLRDGLAIDTMLAGPGRSPIYYTPELEAVRRADLIVTHSPQTQRHFQGFYPDWGGVVHPTPISFAPWISDEARLHRSLKRPFAERDIDVLFAASDWRRIEKDWPIVRKIARRLPGARVHVAGEVAERLPGVVHEGLVADRAKLFALMGNAKVVACPSRLDAAPGVLFEASVMGCNVVTSKNAGNWQLCHPDLVADPPDGAAYAAAVRRGLTGKRPDRREELFEADSYAELTEILTVLAES